jgi:hypothetical protein
MESALMDPAHQSTGWDDWLDYLREHPLHPVLEVVISWFICLCCLLYYTVSYLCLWIQPAEVAATEEFFPLMTSPKGFVETRSTEELWKAVLGKLGVGRESDMNTIAGDDFVNAVRDDDDLRRLLSDLFQQPDVFRVVPLTPVEWKGVWSRLMMLPYLDPKRDRLALVIPAYKEDGRRLVRTLQVAVEHCRDAWRLHIVVVNAGQCTHLSLVHDFLASLESRVAGAQVVSYEGGGGRGPTLDFGARVAVKNPDVGLFTFLHSDTLLPKDWDVTVRHTWFEKDGKEKEDPKKVLAAAFMFGQDKSPEGLDGGPYPWGIEAVQFLGNVRAYALNLPYGDHVISIPARFYLYTGGFPHQPIMEDYEFMDYLRKRAKLRSLGETMKILPSMIRTGVRRWQTHGVVYVTLVNAAIVYRYQQGWTPAEVFRYYYQRPNRTQEKNE